ncbi:MAG: META domain-containing protein [Casimicrobiaceae bacterium]
MRLRLVPPRAALVLAVAACNPVDPGAPLMPGSVNAPPPPMTAAGDSMLTGSVWTWKETVMSDGKRIKPDAPERYTLVFQPGGMMTVRADCNRGSASYLLNSAALSFGPMALTRAMCPAGSMDTEFTKGLGAVAGQLFKDNELVLTLRSDAGSMYFASQRQ